MSKPADHTNENIEIDTLNKLAGMIILVQDGLDPDVIANWYRVIEGEVKARCPTEELRDSIEVVQNPVLPMKQLRCLYLDDSAAGRTSARPPLFRKYW